MLSFFSSSKSESSEAPKPANSLNPEGIKPCCACPDTKSARDACFFNSDPAEANEKCKALVQAHVACMASYGFKV